MRVLLIYPNIDSPVGVNHGLSMISGVLREAGHEVLNVDWTHDGSPHGQCLVADLTDADLGRACTRLPAPGYPDESRTVADCLAVVLEEECEHYRFATRDEDSPVGRLQTAPAPGSGWASRSPSSPGRDTPTAG
mgnify:CR=1 FL=1